MKTLTAVATGMIALLLFTGSTPPANVYYFSYENVLGTSFDLKVIASNERLAENAEQIALGEIDRLDNILSSYKANSEINRWQKTYEQDVLVSPELFEVLSLFDDWKSKTDGALNASVGVGAALWKKASLEQRYPAPDEIALAVEAMKEKHWKLNKENQTARHLSKQPLLLNTFVKSYIIQKVSQVVLAQPGVRGTVVNIGGDIVIAGDVFEEVMIANPKASAENDQPLAVLQLTNKSIATSGNYRRGYQINDRWFSHILDARTGIPASKIISATVVSDNATDAGALATVFTILTPEERKSLADQTPGIEYKVISYRGESFESPGWYALENNLRKEPNPSLKINGAYELTIEIELASFAGRVRRPFVAVWIEDKQKQPVRTLALWYNKPRWLPDLKRWYNKNYEFMSQQNSGSISGATRSPGRYTLKWDGLDDQGKEAPKGVYTVYIEAAREHGTYQLMKQEIEWNGKARHIELKGGTEITAATIDCHKILQ